MATTKTDTPTKTIHSDLTVDPAELTKAERRRQALDEWQNLDRRAKDVSKKRTAARDKVLALGKHGMKVKSSDGEEFMLQDETKETNSHEKVVQALAAKFDVTPAALKKEYAKVAGSRRVRDIKPI